MKVNPGAAAVIWSRLETSALQLDSKIIFGREDDRMFKIENVVPGVPLGFVLRLSDFGHYLSQIPMIESKTADRSAEPHLISNSDYERVAFNQLQVFFMAVVRKQEEQPVNLESVRMWQPVS